MLQKAVIKARVVRYEQAAVKQRPDLASERRKRRRFRNHRVGDAGQRDDRRRNPRARIHERAPFGDLRNAAAR